MDLKEYLAVVAIDFGTSRTGYRFAYTHDPNAIKPNSQWKHALPEGKTLTAVLLNRNDLSFVAFGYEARDFFVASEEKEKLAYFDNFKMVLHDKEGIVRAKVKANNCDLMVDTHQLIATCLTAIKDRALAQLSTSGVPISADKIRWVITVPAIWDAPARDLMNTAAVNAGIPQNNVIIALEPESAVLSCLEDEARAKSSELDLSGNDFMVVDAGGGTIDITVHRKEGEHLVELHSPTGGDWGSSYINKQFEDVLIHMFGKEHVDSRKDSEDWYQVMDSFENAKVKFSPDAPLANVGISAIMPDNPADPAFKEKLAEYNATHGTNLQLQRGSLRLAAAMPVFFEKVIGKIIDHVEMLLANPTLKDVKYLFLVGGFSESPLLKERISKKFQDRVRVILPLRPGSSVVNGAVRYGLNPTVIKERVVSQTIAVQVVEIWDEQKHAGKAFIELGLLLKLCTDCAAVLIHAGSKININHVVKHPFSPLFPGQKGVEVSLYATDKPDMKFTCDEGVKLLGFVVLEFPQDMNAQKEDVFDVELKFGGTTYIVTAIHRASGKKTSAKFSYNLDDKNPKQATK